MRRALRDHRVSSRRGSRDARDGESAVVSKPLPQLCLRIVRTDCRSQDAGDIRVHRLARLSGLLPETKVEIVVETDDQLALCVPMIPSAGSVRGWFPAFEQDRKSVV